MQMKGRTHIWASFTLLGPLFGATRFDEHWFLILSLTQTFVHTRTIWVSILYLVGPSVWCITLWWTCSLSGSESDFEIFTIDFNAQNHVAASTYCSVCMYACMYSLVQTYVHVCMYVCMYVRFWSYIHQYIPHTYTYAYIHIHSPWRTYIQWIPVGIHTHTHTYNTYIHTYIHTIHAYNAYL